MKIQEVRSQSHFRTAQCDISSSDTESHYWYHCHNVLHDTINSKCISAFLFQNFPKFKVQMEMKNKSAYISADLVSAFRK